MSNFYVITGISGSGKTNLADNLKKTLNTKIYKVYDFDDIGIPEKPTQEWRNKAAKFWLDKARDNNLLGIHTVLCGQVVPSEITSHLTNSEEVRIFLGFLHLNEKKIEERLILSRRLPKERIEILTKWAKVIEKEVQQSRNSEIFYVSESTKPEVAELVYEWIMSKSKLGAG